jgi:ABC-type transporter Mla subunit MlaD
MTKIYESFQDYRDNFNGVLVASDVWHARDAEVDALKNRVKELSDAWCNEQRRADEALDKFSNLLDDHNKYINDTTDVDAELDDLKVEHEELTKLYNEVRESEKCLLRIIREKM